MYLSNYDDTFERGNTFMGQSVPMQNFSEPASFLYQDDALALKKLNSLQNLSIFCPEIAEPTFASTNKQMINERNELFEGDTEMLDNQYFDWSSF